MKFLCFLFCGFAFILTATSCKQNKDIAIPNCMENSGKDSLLIFIGKKITVANVEAKFDLYAMDFKFVATYKVLERVCGYYDKDTIEFNVYDHYGRPKFEDYDTVLLYVSKHQGKYYQQKYLFDDLYRTKDGRWASPYPTREYEYFDTIKSKPKPVKIDFASEISYDVAGRKKHYIKQWFPEPYYRIDGAKAIVVYGNYVPELVELKKKGILTARGFYGEKGLDTLEQSEVELAPFEDPVKIDKAEAKQLEIVWKELYSAIAAQNDNNIRSIALDTVVCSFCEGFAEPNFYNDYEPVDTFITACYRNLPNTELWKRMSVGKYELSASKQESTSPQRYHLRPDEQLVIYTMSFPTIATFTKYGDSKYRLYHRFEFIKINGIFKLNGVRSN